MVHDKIIGQHVTDAFTNLIKNEIQLKYPNFYFDKGMILYDYDNEIYLYVGFTEEELRIVNETVRMLGVN